MMQDDTRPADEDLDGAELAAAAEQGEADAQAAELASLREQVDAAKQDVLYAKAETQNVRRRLEKDMVDARAYAATGFARDILSVSYLNQILF